MSKKIFTLVVIGLLLVIGGLFWFFIFGPEGEPEEKTGETTRLDLFPFGSRNTDVPPAIDIGNGGVSSTSTIIISSTSTASLPRLRQISFVPTAGSVVYGEGDDPHILFIERATGHIYETTSNGTELKRISNNTIPKVQEALWSSDGSRLLIRYLREGSEIIRTFSARISTSSPPEEALEGMFLPEGMKTVSVFGSKIFYLLEDETGARGILSNFDDASKKQVFSSEFSDWAAYWSSSNIITLFSRPSAAAVGNAFMLDVSTGKLTRRIGDEYGLSALSNSDGSFMLITKAGRSSPLSEIVDLRSGSSKELGLTTLTEKCVWSKKENDVLYCAVPHIFPEAIYPDDWYKGRIETSDSVWKIYTSSGETVQLLSPEAEIGISLDIIKLNLSPNENTLLFTNKEDLTLWRYVLTE